MSSVYNFCAGPAMLPVDVMKKAQSEFLNFADTGSSVMELSHRSKEFIAVAEKAEADLRNLMAIPENYKVLFCHGGGRGQFSAIALNLLGENKKADYIVTGAWSKSAADEASHYGNINVINVIDNAEGIQRVKASDEWPISQDAAYVHYCPNETVDGIEIFEVPNTGNIPLIADLSSTILSREFDVSKFGLIYAGAQKNIGPSGLTLVIVREDLLGKAHVDTPSIMNYQVLAKNGSMYNTPPTYAWYLAGLVFEWLLAKGGVSAIAEINVQKAQLLYQYIDQSDFYQNSIIPKNRSLMNVPFWLSNDEFSADFLVQAQEQGLTALKGHRMVGGMRASIYNAMPIEGVQALVDFMQEFAAGAK
jgi:phosphoserine aminotransferase